MILIDLWEFSINFFLIGCGFVLMGIGSFIMVLVWTGIKDGLR